MEMGDLPHFISYEELVKVRTKFDLIILHIYSSLSIDSLVRSQRIPYSPRPQARRGEDRVR